MPRSAGDIVADLGALLAAAGVHPPYVLVGHSFGGLVVRLFVSTLPPDEVVGLVLVDAAQEDFWTKLKALMTPEQWEGMITGTPPELADYHDFEKLDVDASAVEMRRAAAATPLRPLPLIVLSRGLPMELPPDMSAKLPANFSAEQERIWRELPRRVGGARARGPARGRHQERALHPDHGAGFGDRCSAASGRGCPPGLVGGCHSGSSLVGPERPLPLHASTDLRAGIRVRASATPCPHEFRGAYSAHKGRLHVQRDRGKKERTRLD